MNANYLEIYVKLSDKYGHILQSFRLVKNRKTTRYRSRSTLLGFQEYKSVAVWVET